MSADNMSLEVREHRIIDLFLFLRKWRNVLLLVCVISGVIGVGLSFIVVRKYKSVARVLPPKESNMFSSLSGLSSIVRNLPGGLQRLGKNDDNYDYIAILRSRTSMEALVNNFGLIQEYESPRRSMEKAIEEFESNLEIDWTEENILEIRVWDPNAQKAADMANYCVQLLNDRNYELQTDEARNTRIFIEQRLAQNKADLAAAEDSLRRYQEKEKMVIPPDASGAGLSSIATLYGEKVKKEIELGVLKQTVGESNPAYTQLQLELNVLSANIAKFPEIGLFSVRLYRNVVIQQKILELIVPLYEQARVNEHKDVPVAYVLDKAVPGERPDKPKRVFVVGITVFLFLMGSFIYIGFREYAQNLSPEELDAFPRLRKFSSRRA